jgi:hypothetical protein
MNGRAELGFFVHEEGSNLRNNQGEIQQGRSPEWIEVLPETKWC